MTIKKMRDRALKQLAISSDLSDEFAKQPGYFARWAFLHARAEDAVRKHQERLDAVFSRLYAEYREQDDTAKENDCKAYIRAHEDYRAAQLVLRTAQHQCDVLKRAVRAFEMKRDMLMQLGADRRAELEGTGVGPRRAKHKEAQRKMRKAGDVIKRSVRRRRGDS